MAGSRRATELVQNRHHIALEVHRPRSAEVSHRHAQLGGVAGGAHFYFRFARRDGIDQAVVPQLDCGSLGLEGRFLREVYFEAVRVNAGDQNAPAFARLAEDKGGRFKNDLCDWGFCVSRCPGRSHRQDQEDK